MVVSVCVIGVTRQDVENSVVHVVRAHERSTYGPQRGGLKEKQKGVEGWEEKWEDTAMCCCFFIKDAENIVQILGRAAASVSWILHFF